MSGFGYMHFGMVQLHTEAVEYNTTTSRSNIMLPEFKMGHFFSRILLSTLFLGLRINLEMFQE